MELTPVTELTLRHDGCVDGAHLVDGAQLVRFTDGSLRGRCVDCGVDVVVRVLSSEALAA